MAPPRISAVIPVYNLEREIARTLSTVRAQTSPPDEVVIVDDGSTDASLQVIHREAAAFPPGMVKVVRQEHRGPGATRNRGIAEASGDWIAFLDGDDLWAQEKVARLRETIVANPWATIVAHDEYESDLRGAAVHKPLHRRFDPNVPLLVQLYRGNFLSTSCVAVKADQLRAVGGLDEDLPSAQDYDLWLKLAREGRLVFIPEPLETYVLRENSISSNVRRRYDCLCLLARRHEPFVARLTGARKASLLRVRFLLSVIRASLVQTCRQRRFAELVTIASSAPFRIAGALWSPGDRSERRGAAARTGQREE